MIRTLRSPLVVVGLLILPLAGTAGAARAKPVCNLIPDSAGDSAKLVPAGSTEDQLDILSADVATNAKRLTAVIRLSSLTEISPTEPIGRVYEFNFSANEKNFILSGLLAPGGNSFEAFQSDQRLEQGESGGRAGTGIGSLVGSVDVKKKEIRMTAELSIFPTNMTRTRLQHMWAATYRGPAGSTSDSGGPLAISGAAGVGADDAWDKPGEYYVAGTASCVAIGK